MRSTPEQVKLDVEEDGEFFEFECPVCPYCGHYNEDDGGHTYHEYTELICGSCGEEFISEMSISYSWTTKPKQPQNGE